MELCGRLWAQGVRAGQARFGRHFVPGCVHCDFSSFARPWWRTHKLTGEASMSSSQPVNAATFIAREIEIWINQKFDPAAGVRPFKLALDYGPAWGRFDERGEAGEVLFMS